MIYLYGNTSTGNDSDAAKVRIVYSRERDDKRGEKADGEWTCKIVGFERIQRQNPQLTTLKCTFLNFAGRVRCHRCQTPQIGIVKVVTVGGWG